MTPDEEAALRAHRRGHGVLYEFDPRDYPDPLRPPERCPFVFRDGSRCRLDAGHDTGPDASWHLGTRPDEPFDPRVADPRLLGFREQRRRSRFGCSVTLLGLVAFWVAAILVVNAVVAAPRMAISGVAQRASEVQSESHEDAQDTPAALSADRAGRLSGRVYLPDVWPEAGRDSQRLVSPPSDPTGVSPPPLAVAAVTWPGTASWYAARGNQGAVPWWRTGQDPVWAVVSRFADGRTYSVTVLVTGFCQCLMGTDRERLIDLSDNAFRQLAPLSVGLIRVQVEVPVQGPKLPQTDRSDR